MTKRTTQQQAASPTPGAPFRLPVPSLRTFEMAGQQFHFSRLTVSGVQELQQFIGAGWAALEAESIGDSLVEGSTMLGQWGRVRDLLTHISFEPLPDGIELAAEPEEIASAINTFFDQSGLRSLGTLLKNSARRTSVAYDRVMLRAAEGITTKLEAEMQTALDDYLTNALDGTATRSTSST